MTSKLLELPRTLDLVRQRGLDETTFLKSHDVRSTLVEMVPDPDDQMSGPFYVGLSLGCELGIKTHKTNPNQDDHTRRQILLLQYAQCMADAASAWCVFGDNDPPS